MISERLLFWLVSAALLAALWIRHTRQMRAIERDFNVSAKWLERHR